MKISFDGLHVVVFEMSSKKNKKIKKKKEMLLGI
jgi:hypothetical protein